LPRKFKIGLAIPEDNTIDVRTNHIAIVALFDGKHLAGYNFPFGGGHGMTDNNPNTYLRLATSVAFIEPRDLLDAAAAVRLHRDPRRPRQPPPCPRQIRDRRERRRMGGQVA
jgi:sulfite reductase (ferredoxin)